LARKTSILAYVVSVSTGVLVFWVNTQLPDDLSPLVSRSILGLVLLIGAAIAIMLFAPETIHPLAESDMDVWGVYRSRGKSSHLMNRAVRGFIAGLALVSFLLFRDYFRESPLLNNLGLYAVMVLLFIFALSYPAAKQWDAHEKEYEAFIHSAPQHNNGMQRTRN
jgi:hypothetical protein